MTTLKTNGAIKTETVDGDVYEGTMQQLIDTGLVRLDQFPPANCWSRSYSRGQSVRGNCRKDENYLKVWSAGDGDHWAILVGVPVEVRRARKAKDSAVRLADRQRLDAAQVRQRDQKEAEKARDWLNSTPMSELAYRRRVIRMFRELATTAIQIESKSERHGYSIDPGSIDPIYIAFDAVVAEIMAATVNFDAGRHLHLVQGWQMKVARVDPAAASMVDRLVQPDPSILAGDAS